MNVDTDTTDVTTSTSTDTDSGANGTAQADNQTHDTGTEATPSADDSASADNQGGSASGSLTDRAENNTPNPKPQTSPDFVPRKDYASLQAEFTRRSQRLKEMERSAQQFDGLTADDIRAWKAQQESATKANLPRWSPQHPERAKFDGLKERYSFARKLIDRAPPAEREARKQEMTSAFAPDELKALEDWHTHREDFSQKFAADPDGTIADIVDQRVEQRLQAREEQTAHRERATGSVNEWFDDPSNRGVVQSQRQWMQEALAENIPWAVVRREAEIRHLRSQLKSGQQTVQSAGEKERLLRSGATVTRDAGSRPVGDLYDRAKKIARDRQLPPGDPRFMDILDQLNAEE